MFDRLARAVLRHRVRVAVLFGIAFLGLSAGAASLKVDFSVMAFFGGDDPAKVDFDAYKAYWGADDDLVLVVATVSEGDLVTRPRMTALSNLEEALRKTPEVKSVSGIVDAPLPDPGAGMIDNRSVLERIPAGGPALAELRRRVLEHPVYAPTLIASDGTATLLVVETRVSSDDVQAVQPMMKALRATLAEHEGKEGLHYATAGIPAVRSDFFEAFMKDQAVYVPLSLLLIVALLAVIFRRVHGVVIPALAAWLPMAVTFGFMGWMGEPIGIINQAYTILLPAIAVADAIHLVARFHEEARRLAPPGQRLTDEVRREAIARALKHIGAACALTSLTTAIGFGSLAVARMPSMRTFGLYAAFGILVAYGVVLLVIPLLLMFVRGEPLRAGDQHAPGRVDRLLLACARFSVDRPLVVLAVTVVIAVTFGWLCTKTVVNNHLTHMLKPDHPTTQANLLADEKLGGIISLEVDLQGPPGALLEPKVLQAMLDLETWAQKEPDVRAVLSPATFVVSLQETLTGERGLPTSSAGVGQLLLFAEGEGTLDGMLSPDRSRGRLQVRTRDIGGIDFTALSERAEVEVNRLFQPTGVTARLTGTPYIAYRGINNVTGDLRESLLLAFVIIALIIGLLIKNATVAFLALLPNALPLVVGYGFLGLVGWLLEPSGAVVFTVALGIAVDDTLHLVVRTREELQRGLGLHEALVNAVLHSGRAVTVTSLILCGGFGVLMLSSFPATALLGTLGALVIFVALLCDLFVLPALLALFGGPLERKLAVGMA